MSISRLYGVDKARAGHFFRAYFIVGPDQVIRMTMLILWKMMMLLKKKMLLMPPPPLLKVPIYSHQSVQ